jgi:hypothetical protein
VQGDQGVQGEVGAQGAQGVQGAQGRDGNFGGATFDYTFDTNTNATDPGTGRLKLNNSVLALATQLYIDNLDDGSTDIQNFLTTIDDSTSTIKGHFRISAKFDSTSFAFYTISALTNNSGYFTANCAYLSGSGWSPNNNDDVIITFARTGDVGDTGPQGVQGATGAQGAVGAQGEQGAVGAQGDQGVQGAVGAQGEQGAQGVQGAQGAVGAQGEQGYQGHQGSQGVQGAQGAQGAVGAQGEQGFQGVQGAQGAQGAVGAQGTEGAQGSTGDKGGLRYTFNTTVTMADPGTGLIRYNNSAIGSVTKVAISDLDVTSTDFSAYLLTADDSTNAVKGYLIIKSNNPSDPTSTIFQINSLVDNVGWVEYDVTYVSGARPSSGEGLVIEFARSGDKGAVGAQGAVGSQGAQGVQGAQGAVGSQGAQGVQGAQGSQGVQGSQGQQGAVGAQGTQGVQGAQGAVGSQGAQGEQGVQGSVGAQGAQGSQGIQGAQGVQGAKGEIPTGAVIYTSGATAPVSPAEGDEWFDTDLGLLFKYINDGDSTQWVEVGPAGSGGGGGGGGAQGAQGFQGVQGAPGSAAAAIAVARNSFVGDGNTNSFTLATAPLNEDQVLVFVNNVFQRNSAYNVSSTTLSFDVAPDTNDVIDAYHITGTAGAQGATGATGAKGEQGFQGVQGASGGPQGAQGFQGVQGTAGAQGSQGVQGAAGTGTKGDKGDSGSAAISVTRNSFLANGVAVDFTLTTTPFNEDHALVFVDRVLQRNNEYNVSSTTLTFDGAPDANANVDVFVIAGTAGPQGPAGAQGVQGATGAGAEVLHPFLLMGA